MPPGYKVHLPSFSWTAQRDTLAFFAFANLSMSYRRNSATFPFCNGGSLRWFILLSVARSNPYQLAAPGRPGLAVKGA